MDNTNKKIQIDNAFDGIDDENIGRRAVVNVDDTDFEVDQEDHFEDDIEDYDEIESEDDFDDYSDSKAFDRDLGSEASRSLPDDWQDFDYYDDDQDWD